MKRVFRECLDHVLVYGGRHLDRVLRMFVIHYTKERPHPGLRLATPSAQPAGPRPARSALKRRDVLGGLIHEYHWAA